MNFNQLMFMFYFKYKYSQLTDIDLFQNFIFISVIKTELSEAFYIIFLF